MKVACIQMRSGTEVGANIEAATILIREAHAGGAKLIATPEMTSLLDRRPGMLLKKARVEVEDEALEAFQTLAEDLKVWLLVGSLPIKVSDKKCVNRSFLITPRGEIAAKYDKIHLFDVDLGNGNVYKESERFKSGKSLVLAETPIGKIGMTVCFDMRFPEQYIQLAKKGAEIITVPSSFTKVTGEKHWHVLLRARAIETGCFITAPAQEGVHEDGRETYGHSLIVNPWGEIIAEANGESGVIYAEIDIKKVKEARRKIPTHFKEKRMDS